MKKILIVHGLGSKPNGGWRNWLTALLAERDIFAFILAMPKKDDPIKAEWIAELARYVEREQGDELYLIGHSLGGATIMRYLETAPADIKVAGVVLAGAPCRGNRSPQTHNFFDTPIDFPAIKARGVPTIVVHGENDTLVPFEQGETIARELGCELVPVPNGGHLNSNDGWKECPPVLNALERLMA